MSKIAKYNRTKKIVSFINKWPEPYRSQAIANASIDVNELSGWSAPIEVLESLFVWSDTPEGGDYWNDFSKTYLSL